MRCHSDKPPILYLSCASAEAGTDILALESRINIGVLSRETKLYLAVVGDLTPLDVNRLKLELGVHKATGGFSPVDDDPPASRGLGRPLEAQTGRDRLSFRLLSAIRHIDCGLLAVVIDAPLASLYAPDGQSSVFYVTRTPLCLSLTAPQWLSRFKQRALLGLEWRLMRSAAATICDAKSAALLAKKAPSINVVSECAADKKKLSPSQLAPEQCDFDKTRLVIGYYGYLGDSANLASLTWFLQQVWPSLREELPELRFLIAGSDAPEQLKQALADAAGVSLAISDSDSPLLAARCRVVVEPLLHEIQVDAKLINAMARGIPVITSLHALKRAHTRLRPGVIAVDTKESMVLAIRRLLTDAQSWQNAAEDGIATAREQLPAFEFAHAVKRQLRQAITTRNVD